MSAAAGSTDVPSATASADARPAAPVIPTSTGIGSGPTGLKVRLTIPPRPRIEPLPSWMNADPSRPDGRNSLTDNWLNASVGRADRADSTGTNSPVSAVSDVRTFAVWKIRTDDMRRTGRIPCSWTTANRWRKLCTPSWIQSYSETSTRGHFAAVGCFSCREQLGSQRSAERRAAV